MVQVSGTVSLVSNPQCLRESLVVPEEATAESASFACFRYPYCLPVFVMGWILQPEAVHLSSWPLRRGLSLCVVSREPNLHGCHWKCISQEAVVMMTLSHVSDGEGGFPHEWWRKSSCRLISFNGLLQS